MLPYEKQLEYKQQEAADAFKRIGKLAEIPMLPIIGSENTIHYRNKLEFTFSNKKFLTAGPIRRASAMMPGRVAHWVIMFRVYMIRSLTFLNAG